MKIDRQSKIIQLVNEMEIETQEELAEKLTASGFTVTQATVSRDIRELRLTKVTNEIGKQKYSIQPSTENQLNDKLIRVLKDGFVSADRAQNILVIRTVSGMAMAVAASLDAIRFSEIVGSIAGDDTIMCAVRTNEDTITVMEKINKIIRSNEK
ncbi:MAG: transcriptional regulator, ArgR family [Clostridiales bacterium]|jgi:transcriptional regulator of arginine metabolism|nr:transcriptional regulator, ArgR family [Clostridiales bacterium]